LSGNKKEELKMKPIQRSSCFKQSCVGSGYQEKEYCPTYNFPEIFAEAKEIYASDSETGLLAKNAAIDLPPEF